MLLIRVQQQQPSKRATYKTENTKLKGIKRNSRNLWSLHKLQSVVIVFSYFTKCLLKFLLLFLNAL